MKLLVLFALCCGAFASPIHIDEEVGREHVPRFALVPDTEGRMYMADLNAELPEEPFFNAENDVNFILFTPENQQTGQPIGLNADQIRASNWVNARPTRFIIHGWNGGAGSGLNSNIGSGYHRNGAFNVVVVDWGLGANTINYISARNRVNEVGPVLARFIDFLHEHGFTDHSRVSIAGHSLGAHIAGIAGKNVQRGRINVIIGLDAAAPLFSINTPGERLDHGDAVYTEGIHTNGGGSGFDVPFAQASFYPNWGRSQPGCGIDLAGTCAHSRAHELFAESVWSNNFNAVRCASYAQITNNQCTQTGTNRRMGGEPSNVGTGADGVFFLQTNGASPFSMG